MDSVRDSRAGHFTAKGGVRLYFIYIQMDWPSGHCPGWSLTFPPPGLCLHDNKIKTLDLPRDEACVALSYFTKR